MDKIMRESRNLEDERKLLVERTEKLRIAQNRILALEHELKEKKDLLSATEKAKGQLLKEKNALEEKEFTLSNRVKQTEIRFQTLNTQLEETI